MAAKDESKPTPTKPTSSLTIKLMVSKKNRRIMYAEAGKDFVDMLCSFLTLPTGVIAKLALRSDTTAKPCCITNLYNSVEALSDSLFKADKSVLLGQKVFSTIYTNDVLNIDAPAPPVAAKPTEPPKYYVCSNAGSTSYKHYLSPQSAAVRCPCGSYVNREVYFVDRPAESTPQLVVPGNAQGYVKKRANFVITDDLSVIPVDSTATIVNLWNKIQVKEPTELEEKNVTVGAAEVLGLLKAAMTSTTALNDVFKVETKPVSSGSPMDTESARGAFQEFLLKLMKEEPKIFAKTFTNTA
ncbi:hypothetical protein SUGI_1163550 [Cryptomeria japonica]|uniref:uncharacterized protein LOC131079211 n=1 Tax=Cryptomeria japonica TaxID=3369 RepID=UPI0024149856|nr:uncharacterized protein LOC131079211 [Cryptomeria japonica]GLJ54249.1 hypothetical protein SUGI_1163550 [Cryptomeria japonica]